MGGKQSELREVLGVDAGYLRQLKGRAQFFLEGGHHERALIVLELLEALDEGDTAVTLAAIDVLVALGRTDAAEERVQRLLSRDPRDTQALVAKAHVLLSAGELGPAAALLAQVIAADPSGTSAASRRARAIAAAAHARLEAAR